MVDINYFFQTKYICKDINLSARLVGRKQLISCLFGWNWIKNFAKGNFVVSLACRTVITELINV